MIERNSRGKDCFFFQVEEGPVRMLQHLGVRCPDSVLLDARTVNSRMDGKYRYSFLDIPPGRVRDELAAMAERYGYELAASPRLCRAAC